MLISTRFSSDNRALNYSQKMAIHSALRTLVTPLKHPVLIHGPPGTGKTHTLSSMILTISVAHPAQTIHVVAPSNAAVREVAIRLLRDSRKTGILHTSQLCLFGNAENVDIADGIDHIFYNLRYERLINLDIRLAQFKQNMDGFHLYMETGIDNQPSITKTWDWRIGAITQGVKVMLAIATDLSEEYATCRREAEQCMSLLKQWLSHYMARTDSLSDLHDNLIIETRSLLPVIRLKRPLRGEDLDAVIHSATKVVFSTVNSAGGGSLKASFKKRPLVILDEDNLCLVCIPERSRSST